MQRIFWALAGFCAFAAWHAGDLYLPWLKFQSEAWAGVALVFLALAQRGPSRHKLVAPRKPDALSLCLLALPLLAGLHVLTSATVYVGDAALLTLYVLGALLALGLGHQWATGPDSNHLLKGLCLLLMVSALCSVAEALYQWLLLDGLGHWVLPIPSSARPSGNFAQANRMAMHTATGLAALVWLYRQNTVRVVVMSLGGVFLCLGIALTQSRAGLLSVMAILLVAVLLQRRNPRAGALYIALIVVAFLLFWQLPVFSQALDLGAVRTNRLALGSRGTLLAGFAQSVFEKPWWGYGPGQIVYAQFFLIDQGLPAQVSFWAHHVLLDFALMFGVPVVLAVAAALALYVLDLLGNLQHENNQFVLMAIIPFAIMLNTEFPHAYLNSLLLFAFIAGMIKSRYFSFKGWFNVHANAMNNVLISAFFILSGVIFYDYRRMENAFQVARFEAMHTGSIPKNYQYPSALVLDNLEALVAMARRKTFYPLTPAELGEYQRSAMRFPYESALRGYAIATALNSAPRMQENALRAIDALYGRSARLVAERAIKRHQAALVIDALR